jgi:hypothetical protein
MTGLRIEDFWQPIETAPCDGTPVIVCGPYHVDVSIAAWDGKSWYVQADGGDVIDSIGVYGATYKTFDQPTYWMPVPKRKTMRYQRISVLRG